jgi:hypothetical protein
VARDDDRRCDRVWSIIWTWAIGEGIKAQGVVSQWRMTDVACSLRRGANEYFGYDHLLDAVRVGLGVPDVC